MLETEHNRIVKDIQKWVKNVKFLEQQVQELHEEHVKDTQVCPFAIMCHNKKKQHVKNSRAWQQSNNMNMISFSLIGFSILQYICDIFTRLKNLK